LRRIKSPPGIANAAAVGVKPACTSRATATIVRKHFIIRRCLVRTTLIVASAGSALARIKMLVDAGKSETEIVAENLLAP
jgi:hypothetical protein